MKDYFEIAIASITIRFQTNHQSDIDCLERLFLYHTNTNNMPYKAGQVVHNVIITSSNKPFDLPKDIVPVYEGFVSAEYPVTMVWHNSMVMNENFIIVGNDILIRHIPESNLTVCYLQEKKNRFRKSHRPLLNIYIFLLIHNILSMYGKYSIHSACVAKNGLAYLFSGKSGSGKTTISTMLSRADFSYMGDDLAFISRNEKGEIVVDSFLCNAKIAHENLKSKKLEKEIIDVIKEYDFTYSYHQKLGAIFRLQRNYSNEASILQPLSHVNMYTWLLQSGNNIKMQYKPQLWLDICEQATALPAYDMFFSNKEYFKSEILNDVINK